MQISFDLTISFFVSGGFETGSYSIAQSALELTLLPNLSFNI